MKLWSETTEPNAVVDAFTVGNDREMDVRIARWDVVGSIAHAEMLGRTGIIDVEESRILIDELQNMLVDIDAHGFVIDEGIEDVHSQVEFLLCEKLGDIGKKIHTGRSRNDQVLVDLKLWLRHETRVVVQHTLDIAQKLLQMAKAYEHVLLPGYTHYQVAMPSSFGLWFGGYAEALLEDVRILEMAVDAADANPLGSAAGYGSSFGIDRQMTTEALNFNRMHVTSTFAQMSRGRTEKLVAIAVAQVASTLARFAADVVLYMCQNFGFVSLSPTFTTGSSIMPHKKNPDVFEVLRARCNRLQALPAEIAFVQTNLPSGYHRDMQFIKDTIIPAVDELRNCLVVAGIVVPEIVPNEKIFESGQYDMAFTVERINELVLQGVPFRDAYKAVALSVQEGTFMRPAQLEHTHIGSIGNTGLDVLQSRLDHARAHRR